MPVPSIQVMRAFVIIVRSSVVMVGRRGALGPASVMLEVYVCRRPVAMGEDVYALMGVGILVG